MKRLMPSKITRDKNGDVVVELRRKDPANAPKHNEAFYRLQCLFPCAPADILHKIIAMSPHEEAAVYRLSQLG